MNTKDIPEEILKLHGLFVEKTGKQPYLSINLSISGIASKPFEIAFHYKGMVGSKYCNGATAESAIKQAFKYVNAKPTIAEQRLAEFQGDLANLIDKGRDFNIDLDFVNPLIETSKRLAENAIEHKGDE